MLKYVLITAAKNEENYLEKTIQSVVSQTVLPIKWIIVSDGSTDRTEGIAMNYAERHKWIVLISLPPRPDRHFAGKAIAFNVGYASLSDINYDIIGNLDADISFEKDYMEFLLKKFVSNLCLGVAGTPFLELSQRYNYNFSRKEHVSGACQLFRRECFESIGGYIVRKEGGIDLAAVVTARMKGWKTETFMDKYCTHNRPMGKAGPHFLKYAFRSGYGDYQFGVHPAWQFFRCIYQMSRKPFFSSGFLLLIGYFWAMITRADRAVPEEFVIFRKKEQATWLRSYFNNLLLPLK